ncbi:class III extradiol ring-cleavage dioxygenase [Methylomonas sp. AM2-LC]|uniref:DODA-type extradiol aromatic ring-opening family dioxygenase n=1 Tax=Methylomonas sp. AM2-LC TaxID=3153301 RepID=UPI0032655524
MPKQSLAQSGNSVVFIPHGAGPLPLLGDKSHQNLHDFLQTLPDILIKPSAILVISAHWEADRVTVSSTMPPKLLYDYYGFPDAAYQISYSAPGEAVLAERVLDLLKANGIPSSLDNQRGFDHGLFVPLKIMYPDAKIPCIQLSLLNNMDAAAHIRIGKALTALKNENVLIIGSGFSFHNMQAFFSDNAENETKNQVFTNWLIETCTLESVSEQERESRLTRWNEASFARFCHPREEHLLPLHVCYGIAQIAAKLVFHQQVAGKSACAFVW